MRRSPFLVAFALLWTALGPTQQGTALACEFCLPEFGGPMGAIGPNTYWQVEDNVWVCPGGDSVAAGVPSKLRIEVWYADANCLAKVAVPPESIWVTYSTVAGNLVVNDKGANIYADDSTDVCGHTRITIASFSGCGTLQLNLNVSGIAQGSKNAIVSSLDVDASGRLGTIDVGMCDPRPGQPTDHSEIFAAHYEHWHRNALHGTQVRRTNYCETCPAGAPGTKGGSQIFWSPSARYIAHTQFVQAGEDIACKVFIVPSDPKEGNSLTQFTFAPFSDHDYDPSWSPRNDFIVWDRRDKLVIRKQVPWSGDPTEVVVTTSDNPGCGNFKGDTYPAISPDGQWVVFSRCNGEPPGGESVWKIPITGGTAIQLTPTVARSDHYASWSPDGQTIYFQRQDETTYPDNRWTLWKVPAAGGMAQEVFVPPGSPLADAVQPALSPDGRILLMGHGVRDFQVRNVVTHTLDPALLFPDAHKVVPNYPDTNFAEKGDYPLLSPRLSHDGTRAGLGSKQIWAARRNMNLPPAFTSVTSGLEGTRSIADTAATMAFQFNTLETGTITVSASDPGGDALTYRADFLQPWMMWNPMTRTLSGEPIRGSENQTFYVRFSVTTPSGGTDSFIALITVRVPLGSAASMPGSGEGGTSDARPGKGLAPGVLAVTAPRGPEGTARLAIFDLTGRRVALLSGSSGSTLVWDGRDDRTHAPAAPGIYFYRMEAGDHRREGKVVVVR